MINKRLGMAALFFGIIVLPVSASMISFLVLETGLPPEANIVGYADVWEDGIMGAFFDEGHIVSNYPAMRAENYPEELIPLEARGDYEEAFRGGAEFFVLVLLEYKPQGGIGRPLGVSIWSFTAEDDIEAVKNPIYQIRFPSNIGLNLRDEYVRAQET